MATTNDVIDIGHYPDFPLRVARSQGYATGCEGGPRSSPKNMAEAEVAAWYEGYDRAAAIMSAPYMKPEGVTSAKVQIDGNAGTGLAATDDRRRDSDRGVTDDLRGPREPAVDARQDDQRRQGNDIRAVEVPVVERSKDRTAQEVQGTTGVGSCGIVAIVNLMNVLVRAFFAGQPSAINGVRSMFETLGSVIERLSPEYLIFALDGGHTERTELFPDYNAHRPPKPPVLEDQIILAEQAIDAMGWPAIRIVGWEADDVIASLATSLKDVAIGTVAITSDKDLLQLMDVTRIYHPWKGGEFITGAKCVERYGVRPDQIWDYLSLCGDTSDGVPGVHGIGKKTAAKLLTTYESLDGILAAAERQQIPGANGKRLREQAPAARLSRQLVTLKTDLPVGSHWSEWPRQEPRAGWLQKMVPLGLGTPAHRIASRLPAEGRDRGNKSSLMVIEMAQVDRLELTNPEVEAVIEECGMTPVEAQRYRQAVAPSTIAPVDDISTWPMSLGALPRNAPLLDKVRAVYRTGLEYRSNGRRVTNDWKRDCAFHTAYDDGLNGRPLSVQLSDYDANGVRVKASAMVNPPPAPADPVTPVEPAPIGERRRQPTLF